MAVHSINQPHAEKVEAVLKDLLEISREQGFSSFMFIAEANGRRSRMKGVVGRFRADPLRVIGELVLMKGRLVKMVAPDSGFADSRT